MPDTINGLPTHVLLVHAVIVLLPLAALMLVVGAAWPTARRKLGFLTPLFAFVALVFVPISTDAGEWLERHVADTPLVRKHVELGDSLLPWAIGVFVLAAALWWIGRRYGIEWRSSSPTLPTWVSAAVLVVCVAVSGGAIYQLYRIGDSGAKAAWTGNFSTSSTGGDPSD